MDSIGDTQGFSGKTPITLSGCFSIEILTGVTPSWKTELNRSIFHYRRWNTQRIAALS